MVILILLFLQLLYFLRKAKWDKNLVLIILFSAILNIGFLTILHFELLMNGQSTYGSDESDYYQTMLFANQMDNFNDWITFLINDYNFTYVLYGALILKTSWFDSVYLVRLGNVLLFLNILAMVYMFTKRFIIENPKNLNFLILFLCTNGILIWTAIRNLKDIFFVYMLMIFLYSLFDLIFKKKFNFKNLIAIAISSYVLQDIRQWFVYFIILLLFVIFAVELLKKRRVFSFMLISGVMSVILIVFAREGLEILRVYTMNRFSSTMSLTQLPIYMGQFVMGPGPIRGVFGNEAFVHTTTTGNILITFGALAWWFFVPIFFLALLSWKNIKQNYIVLIVLMFYWMTYSYANMGSGDTRIRAAFYILSVIYTLPYIENIRSKSIVLKYLVLALPLFLIGLYFSYNSLV